MARQNEEKMSIQPTLKLMQVGEMVAFPVERHNSVKTSCTLLGYVSPFPKFSSHINRENMTVEIIRVS